MNGVVLLLALAAPSVDFGWRVGDDGDVECIVQLEPQLAAAMRDGDIPRTLVRDTSPRGDRPAKFVVQIGDDLLPRKLDPPLAVEPTRYRIDSQAFPNADLVKHGWRLTEDGGLQCVLHIAPQLATAAINGTASSVLTGDKLPASARELQFVIYVTDDPLPADVVDSRDLSLLESSKSPRVIRLSHTEPSETSSGRTVFETQLQLRRGEADSRFDDAASPAQPSRLNDGNRYGGNPDWTGAGSRPSALTIGDSTPSRYGGAPARIGENNAAPGRTSVGDAAPGPAGDGGLQIRFGDGASTPAPPAASSRIVEPTERYAPSPSRFSATPPAPPLTGSGYGATRTPEGPNSRTALGPTGRAPAPYVAPPQPAAQPSSRNQFVSGQNNYGPPGPAAGATGPAGYPYSPNAFAAQPTAPAAGTAAPLPATGGDPRLAARGAFDGTGRNLGASLSGRGGTDPAVTDGDSKKLDELEDTKDAEKKVEAEPQWIPLVMAVMALLASLSGNAYLGHLAYGFYRRYRDMTDELRAAPNFASSSLDSDDERSRSSGGRRRRRSRLAARF